MAKKNIIIALVAVLGVGLLGFNTIKSYFTSATGADRVPCVNPALPVPAELHIHPQLKIVIDGQNVEIPANIGLELAGCHRVLHTHDGTGEVHVEPNFAHEYTLGDFFSVWNKPFSKNEILDKKSDDTHEVVMTVDGARNEDYDKLILKDKQQIVIEYKTK